VSTPRYSIVIPTYRRGDQLAECLESVCALDYPKDAIEIVIIDNGGEQNTRNVALPFQSAHHHTRTSQRGYGFRTAASSSPGGVLRAQRHALFPDLLKESRPSGEIRTAAWAAGDRRPVKTGHGRRLIDDGARKLRRRLRQVHRGRHVYGFYVFTREACVARGRTIASAHRLQGNRTDGPALDSAGGPGSQPARSRGISRSRGRHEECTALAPERILHSSIPLKHFAVRQRAAALSSRSSNIGIVRRASSSPECRLRPDGTSRARRVCSLREAPRKFAIDSWRRFARLTVVGGADQIVPAPAQGDLSASPSSSTAVFAIGG
jgi:hypothetical protein